MNISYDYYRVFYYAAKYRSFTGAASALFNNQPNITRMMRKLEEQLGCALFIRQRHGITLTPEGEKLYAHISIAFEHILCGEEEIVKDRSLESGTVTVAASEIALHCVLLPALKRFRTSYPGVHIRMISQSTPQAIDAIKKGLADFAVVTEPFSYSAGLTSHILKSIREVPVCSTAFPLSPKIPLAWDQLIKYPVICLGHQTGSYLFFSDFFNKMGIPFAPDVEAATADQILPMVKSDLGIGFIPADFLEKENRDNLTVLSTKTDIPSRNICLLKRNGVFLSIAASKLEELILCHANGRQPS